MNRRAFAGMLGKLALVPLALQIAVTSGCTFDSVWNDLKKYAPVGLSAVASVVSILTGAGVVGVPTSTTISFILGIINKGFGDLTAAINQYQAAPAASKDGIAGQISEILTVIETNIQQFWSDLTIPDAKLADLVQGLLGIITSTLAGFLTQLPAPVTPVAIQATRVRAQLKRTIPAVAKKRSLSAFKSDFNSLLKDTQYKQHTI